MLQERVVIVTGAGRGLGRAYAIALAEHGAKVVVNDLGVGREGQSLGEDPASDVVALIQKSGGEAIAHRGDITSPEDCVALLKTAIDTFGTLDVVVNNAGFVRDRMFVSSTVDEWDAVMRIHLRGHYLLSREASAFWRKKAKAGQMPDARIINTSSGAGLLGSVAQSSYSAAKGGIATLTLVQAAEMGRYGVTANALAPVARTRMTEAIFADMMQKSNKDAFDPYNPSNVAMLVVWLASTQSSKITGRVFELEGGQLTIMEGWRHGPKIDLKRRWNPEEFKDNIPTLLEKATPQEKIYGG